MNRIDRMTILPPIPEWTVLQHKDGYAELQLCGNVYRSDELNYPVLNVVDVSCERIVQTLRPTVCGTHWQCRARLKTGMYRIETGVALLQADFNPYYLGRGDVLRNLFVGEVFVIAGQSNAAGYGKGEIHDCPQYGVSLWTDRWGIASHPIGLVGDGSANADALNCGHSAWLDLGKEILNRTGTPVGLVPTALSGSSIDAWAPGQPLFENMAAKAAESRAAHLIWYQGCTDIDNPDSYERKLDAFIRAIRQRLGAIAIDIVQISGTTNAARPDRGWRVVREAQRRVAVRHGLGLTPTYDLTRYSDDIHLGPQDNLLLASRVYQAYVTHKPAGPISARLGDVLELTFTEAEQLDDADAGNLFALDDSENAVPCSVSFQGNTAVIRSGVLAAIRYVTLPFGRLYGGKTLHDACGNPLAYFCADIPELLREANDRSDLMQKCIETDKKEEEIQ